MKYNPQYHHRRSIRLLHYDYSRPGFYFVTICTHQKQCLFGEMKEQKMGLNQIGKMVRDEWLKSAQICQEIELDEWVIMPNHLHGIVVIQKNDDGGVINNKGAINVEGARHAPLRCKPKSLSSFVAGFKSSVTKRIKVFCSQPDFCIWQRNYYESVVRNEQHLNKIRHYIFDNPQKWAEDIENHHNNSQGLLIDLIF